MNIQNQPTGPSRSNPLRSGEAGQAQDAAESSEAGTAGKAAEATDPNDRVEISDAARAAQSGAGADAALVQRGREALEASSLSGDRLDELQQRVESGYYTEAEATQQIAERLAQELGGA